MFGKKKLGHNESDISNGTVSVGKAILNTTFEVIDENLREVSNGATGELIVSGIQLMKGYKNDPKKTSDVMLEINGVPYYRTGDLAFKDIDGCYIVGRMDDTVKISRLESTCQM